MSVGQDLALCKQIISNYYLQLLGVFYELDLLHHSQLVSIYPLLYL